MSFTTVPAGHVAGPMAAGPMIEIEGVHTPSGQLGVRKGMTMTVDRGETVSVIGSFGSGKSTDLPARDTDLAVTPALSDQFGALVARIS